MKFVTRKILMVACLALASLTPSPVLADDDPFGNGDDPFATRKLTAAEAEIAQLKHLNKLLQRKLESNDQHLKTATDKSNQMFISMLNSQNESLHTFALANLDVLTCEWKMIADPVKRFVNSQNPSLRQLAIKALIQHAPTEALKMGFQTPEHIWLPMNLDEKSAKILHHLVGETYSADHVETPLSEFVEVLQDDFRFNIKLHISIDPETLITYRVQGVKLENMLRDFSADHEWKFVIQNQMLKIVPKNYQEEPVLLVYNVDGLVQSRGINIDRLIEYLSKNVAGGDSISLLSNSQFSLKASMSKQIEVGKALAALSQ